MKIYSADRIRNIALLGHSSSGKTTLTEAALYVSGAISRQGRVDDGNTISDFKDEEIQRCVSIATSSIPLEYKNIKYNILDTPGYFDFIGEMYGAKRASESTILVIDASSGIEVGTEKAWKNLEKYNTPRFIFLNKMDKEDIDFEVLLEDINLKFDQKIIPFTLPIYSEGQFIGFVDIINNKEYLYDSEDVEIKDMDESYIPKIKELRFIIQEKIAETCEELMLKYFDGESFTDEEICEGIKCSILDGELVPLFVGSAYHAIGIDFLLESIEKFLPSANDIDNPIGEYNGEMIQRGKSTDDPFSAIVFKTIIDPYIGKLSLIRVLSGELKEGENIYNSTRDKFERPGGVFILRGKKQIDTDVLIAGDIGAISRLESTKTGDTLSSEDNKIIYEPIEYPKPNLFLAVKAKTRDDEDKLGSALKKLNEEDPTFELVRNSETKELLIGGQGNMQIRAITEKLKNTFDIEVDLSTPKIAYRETIKSRSDVQGRHKKQSGGAGQYGDVHIRFEPCEEEFIFEEEVFGGSVPKNYFPAVEKGLEEARKEGVLGGFPVVNIKATLHDGSHHPVDSNEMAFKIAASMAFKKGIKEAEPILLEPIMELEIKVPEEYMGDIMGDMNKRRGRVMGMEQDDDGNQIVRAEAPQAEVFDYAIDLRAMTQSRASFSMKFLSYEEVPIDIAEKIIDK